MLGICNVNSKGQVTIPVDMRKELGIKDGGKVVFIKQGNKICIANASMVALEEIQKEFKGEAEKIGWKDENDVVNYIAELRKNKLKDLDNESND